MNKNKISEKLKIFLSTVAAFVAFKSPVSAQGLGEIGSAPDPNSNINNGDILVNIGGNGFAVDPAVANSGNANTNQLLTIVDLIDRIVNAAFIILIGVVFVLFMWNLVMYLRTRDEAYQKSMIRDFIILFVSVAIWGLVAVVSRALGIGVGGTGVRPAI